MLRVLIVEDELRIRIGVARVLSRRGFFMDQAGTVHDAKELLRLKQYDAVLLDWELPDGTGLDLCHFIRSSRLNVYVLMVTCRDNRSDRLRAFDAGADDYVVKQDIDIEEIGARLRAFARRLSSKAG